MSGIQANLLLQGVANSSPWLSTEQLLAPAKQNALLEHYAVQNRQSEQTMAANEIEYAARAAQGLLGLGDEAAMAAAYPGAVATAQQYGFLKKAPVVFPGKARLEQIAAMGTPAKDQADRVGLGRDYTSWRDRGAAPPGATPGATPGTATPGAAPVPIPARGTGGPGTSVEMPPELLAYFREASAETGIPMDLLIAQARQESGFRMDRPGAAGEIGIMQIKPSTARDPGGMAGVDPATLSDARQNILFGARYLRSRMQGDPNDPAVQAAALARYNGGGDKDYVAHVNRYRPGQSPTDPARAVTTYTPGGATGGVAARTGGTDVAGPPGTVPPPGAAPGAVAPVATPGTATTAQPPPGGTTGAPVVNVPPPPPRLPNGLDAQQNRTIQDLKAIVPRNRAEFDQQQRLVATKEQEYRQHNETLDRQYRTDVQQAQQQAQTQANQQQSAAALAEQRRIENERAAASAAALAEQRRIENARAGVPTGHQRNPESGVIEQIPGYKGATESERLEYDLKHADPSSREYAEAWKAKKWQVAPNGSVIEQDMSGYTPPTRSIQRPTFIPQPTGTALDAVRKADTDARVIVPAIDRYVDLQKGIGGSSWGAYFDNPKDPKAQQLIGAFNAMKTVLRSPTYANTGVLQPAEMEMLQQELVSPQTIRGLYATPQALEARLHEIKFAILSRQDAELRSVGKDGVIVRDKSDLAKIPEGGKFYDEDGNLRIKPRAE